MQQNYFQRSNRVAPLLTALVLLSSVFLLGACGSGGGGSGSTSSSGTPGDELSKPNGAGTFFVDANSNGRSSRIRIVEMFWGRLVDVHGLDGATGEVDPAPAFRDWVINENVLSDGTSYVLETNPITQLTRLIIQREKGRPAVNGASFSSLLSAASRNLPPILPKNDNGTSAPPFSLMSRNACLVVRVDDLLDDSDAASLQNEVRLVTGYSPIQPFAARIIFDPNHGGVAFDNQFHSSRILLDMTVSQAELAASTVPLLVNSLGLPASLTTTNEPNVTLRIPTEVDFSSGLFSVLENVAGGQMAVDQNGPVDSGSPTVDLVRTLRAGNETDTNNGFLLDLNLPEVLGGWPLSVTGAANDPAGALGFDFVIDLTFGTQCQTRPLVGDIVQVGDRFLEVTAAGTVPQNNRVPGVRARVLTTDGIANTNQLLGAGVFLSTYDPFSLVDPGCWITFTPLPGVFPTDEVSPNVKGTLRFSEPMDPLSVVPFDTFLFVRGTTSSPATARSIVVGEITPSGDLKDFSFEPVLPLSHSGASEPYHVEIIGGAGGMTDLAGNPLANVPDFVDFSIDPNAPLESNNSIVLRFDDVDEYEPTAGFNDLRGQFFFNFEEGKIRPRPVAFRSVAVDRTNPVPSIMIPFPPGIQTPLSPLGSKLQALWRYCDLAWTIDDETNFNIDVIGMSWSPIGGTIVADFYEEFEILLSHSNRLPDEALDENLLPDHPFSGLLPGPAFFTENILRDPRNPGASQKSVHPRAAGYTVDPTTTTLSATGTPLVPWPVNLGLTNQVTYTWRDTAITSVGGPANAGVPMDIETLAPLMVDPRASGSIAASGVVPSYGLPLLMEFRCYPSSTGIGLNPLDISLAVNSSAAPNFRVFSTGGFNTDGDRVMKDPDLELIPSGGFNPGGSPPGSPTANDADNTFYVGQIDLVTRVSRVHTVFLDAILASPDYSAPRVEPRADDQPLGTSAVLEFRGATGFEASVTDEPFDARRLDPYGNPRGDPDGNGDDFLIVNYLNGDATWKIDINQVDSSRFLQIRISFFNNIQSGTNAELSAIGIAYQDS